MSTRRRLRDVVSGVRKRLRAHDLPLAAAGLTFYGALGGVPLLAVAARIAAALLGADAVRQTGSAAARYLPRTLDLGPAVRHLADAGARLSWGPVLAGIVIASLFSEGAVRTFERFSPARERHARTLRGRMFTVVLVAEATVAVLLAVGIGRPLLRHDFGTGTGPRLFGIWLAFVMLWIPGTALLAVLYRVSRPAGSVPAPPCSAVRWRHPG